MSPDLLPLAPDHRWYLGLTGSWNGFGGETYSRIDIGWTDETTTDNALDPRSIQDPYTRVNGRVGWRNQHFDISAWILNATDTDVIVLSAPQTLFGAIDGGLQVFLNDPRTYGVTIRYSF